MSSRLADLALQKKKLSKTIKPELLEDDSGYTEVEREYQLLTIEQVRPSLQPCNQGLKGKATPYCSRLCLGLM